ncbi:MULTISPECIES: helix-turn-helix transcriptional regulator [Vagococcus]|uniref:helix-turn-helix transcriptional regulator n=1 Tax=Vagococcus TaxID=2737 RepID=UPI001F510A53|nr:MULTISPECIES: helix-turn-helix transcriptional regulator [Vagococcus]MCI0131460.1 helix-turn-helix domain-containing protein [Vagococcus sp. CY53-2]MDT2783020.1 helix-turn-helix transcriptional regulator [Vagococcus fluvialis]MDT2832234.1 helix-turn-helix transcriptional regulator [Vagococcus carniphilus]MDT2841017.1 helix-turn-helix transcriptional regulator [Vagococcus carniphilus]MDT2855742.1 helix-turn-helix transcriptional regulator [Vagococcus carniphilus]
MKETILAIKLKEYRTNNNLTQSDLAEKLDVSDKTISKWELGETYPSKRNMLKLSDVLGISLETLLLEEQADDTNELKSSVKYGLVSFCLIFFVTMVVFSFTQEHSQIFDLAISKQIELLGTTILRILSISVPPAIIITCVFYFYIFPKNKKSN